MPKTRKSKSTPTKLITILNNKFQDLMRSKKHPEYHRFFNDSVHWNKTYKESSLTKNTIHHIPKEYDIDLHSLPVDPVTHDCKYIPSTVLTKKQIYSFYDTLNDPAVTEFTTIKSMLLSMYDYTMPSTLKNTSDWKQHKEENAINVIILGAGPVGLYTALQLHTHYNDTTENDSRFSTRNVNIIMIDNRIVKEGIKMPYTRSTKLGLNISILQPFLKNILCWTGANRYLDNLFEYICIYENLLYIVAYAKNIPMLFTNQFDDFNVLKTFVEKEHIHAVFDCTGGRYKTPLTHSLPWSGYSFTKGAEEVKLNKITQMYELYEKEKQYVRPLYFIHIYDKDKREVFTENAFLIPSEKEDIDLLEKYKNNCFAIDDYIKLSSNFKGYNFKYWIPWLVEVTNEDRKDAKQPLLAYNQIKYAKITTYNWTRNHAAYIATKFNKNAIYIRLGDSLGTTEYGQQFGVKHSMLFGRYISTILSIFL
jgi:hypothetical protein